MYFYCYHCWSDFEESSDYCPKCGKELSSFSALNFHEKLIRALDHPERLTLQRAIWIIGNLRLGKAVPKLSVLSKNCQDFVIISEIINTLIKIGSAGAVKIVEDLSTHPSSIVRKYASGALRSIAGSGL